MCQKKGRFFRFSSAKRTAKMRHMYLLLFGPRCLDRKSRTAGRLDIPMAAAVVVTAPTITPRRVDADMVVEVESSNMYRND